MALITKRIRISGMSCINCQKRITAKLRGTPGIREASVSYRDGTARIAFDSAVITYEQIAKIIDHLGYKALPDGKTGFGRAALLSALVLVLYVLLEKTGLLNLLVPGKLAESGMGYGMLFVVGLLTSVHCIAMCGGINLSQCLPGSVRQKNALLPSLCYNAGRVISYTVIGLAQGLSGLLSCEAQVELKAAHRAPQFSRGGFNGNDWLFVRICRKTPLSHMWRGSFARLKFCLRA